MQVGLKGLTGSEVLQAQAGQGSADVPSRRVWHSSDDSEIDVKMVMSSPTIRPQHPRKALSSSSSSLDDAVVGRYRSKVSSETIHSMHI